MDAVQQANSGHPGTPMAMAPVAYALWQRHLRFDPDDPIWPNRDRFVLSMGHASMLLYSMLHLAGVKAVNPKYETLGAALGHPRRHQALPPARQPVPGPPRVPLDVGRRDDDRAARARAWPRASGMAIASKWMAAHFNRPGFPMFGFDVYALAGDGCLMEGDLAARRRRWPATCSSTTSAGSTTTTTSRSRARPRSPSARTWPRASSATAGTSRAWATPTTSRCSTAPSRPSKKTTDRPTLIIVDSHIGYGAPTKQDTHAAHGEPLGEEEIKLAKRFYGWPEDAKFLVPDGVREHFARGHRARAGRSCAASGWRSSRPTRRSTPQEADALYRMQHRQLPEGWDKEHPRLPRRRQGPGRPRRLGEGAERGGARTFPGSIGGSADLAPSTKTRLTFEGAGDFEAGSYGGRNFHFGIREHAMGAVLNGLSLSKVRPYGSGFLIFSDYGRPADPPRRDHGDPGHLRLHPRLDRRGRGRADASAGRAARCRCARSRASSRSGPRDANEVAEAWRVILELRHEPAALILTRQALPTLDRTKYAAAVGPGEGRLRAGRRAGRQARGPAHRHRQRGLALRGRPRAAREGRRPSRVVSMPSWELFDDQPRGVPGRRAAARR